CAWARSRTRSCTRRTEAPPSEQIADLLHQPAAAEHHPHALPEPGIALLGVREPQRILAAHGHAIDADVALIAHLAERVLAHGPPEAALLDAAEGRLDGAAVGEHVVDQHAAGLDALGEAPAVLAVGGEDVGVEAEVRLVGEAHGLLLARDLHEGHDR